ncbi:unnamed protein product [Paramecium octaurelia]|uniref:Cation/H+ exchanger transmembrane domain-containing protein n=1 Tax=Paramecium octaurelia TaxID=43137 RepID=A0A8S1SUN6_PAROT|nr:unnamed protein product [Paramecium octaurelia]
MFLHLFKKCGDNIDDSNETSLISDSILLIIGLLVFNELLLQTIATKKLKYPYLKYINDTIITTSIGLITGYILTFSKSGKDITTTMKMGFSQLFLIILLPPILFESAIHMDSVTFFEHFGTINIYAIFGTIISMIITSFFIFICGLLGLAKELQLSKCFAFGAIISSTDPVAVLSAFKNMKQSKMLYTFIFGESILNDAVSLTLFNAVNEIINQETSDLLKVISQFLLIFFLSIAIGYAMGIISAFVIRFKNQAIANFEASLLLLLPWITYLISEALEMSGIVSIMFCGISMARYTIPNTNELSKKEFTKFYEIIAHIFENSVFIFIGIGVIGFNLPYKETGFGIVISTFLAINLSRYFFVFVITKFANQFRSIHTINEYQMNMLWFSGLRGAMAYALSIQTIILYGPIGEVLLTISIAIIMINIYVQGVMLDPILTKYSQNLIENYEVEEQEKSKNIFKQIKEGISQIDNLFIQICLSENNDEEVPLQNGIQGVEVDN